MVLSLAPITNLPRLVNSKKTQLDTETSDSVDGSLRTEKTWLEFIKKNETKLTKITYISSFFVFKMCQNRKTSNIWESYYLKLSKNQREKTKNKITFFC